jgi:hypothetical protein
MTMFGGASFAALGLPQLLKRHLGDFVHRRVQGYAGCARSLQIRRPPSASGYAPSALAQT